MGETRQPSQRTSTGGFEAEVSRVKPFVTKARGVLANWCSSETKCILNRDIGRGGGRTRCEEHRWGNDFRNMHFYQLEGSEKSRASPSVSLHMMTTRRQRVSMHPPSNRKHIVPRWMQKHWIIQQQLAGSLCVWASLTVEPILMEVHPLQGN